MHPPLKCAPPVGQVVDTGGALCLTGFCRRQRYNLFPVLANRSYLQEWDNVMGQCHYPAGAMPFPKSTL